MSETDWQTKNKWPTKIRSPVECPGDFLECELVVEEGALRSKSYLRLRIHEIKEQDSSGLDFVGAFIGSDEWTAANVCFGYTLCLSQSRWERMLVVALMKICLQGAAALLKSARPPAQCGTLGEFYIRGLLKF